MIKVVPRAACERAKVCISRWRRGGVFGVKRPHVIVTKSKAIRPPLLVSRKKKV